MSTNLLNRVGSVRTKILVAVGLALTVAAGIGAIGMIQIGHVAQEAAETYDLNPPGHVLSRPTAYHEIPLNRHFAPAAVHRVPPCISASGCVGWHIG